MILDTPLLVRGSTDLLLFSISYIIYNRLHDIENKNNQTNDFL